MSMDSYTTRDMFFCRVNYAAGVPSILSQVGPELLTIVDNGVGDFSLILPAAFEIPTDRTKAQIVARSAIDAKYVYDEANSDAGEKRFRCFDAAAAALDNINAQVEIGFVMFGIGG